MIYLPRRSRRGTMLVAVLACLITAMALSLLTVQQATRLRRECKIADVVRQTYLLVDAGVSRAMAKLEASPSYDGEIWSPRIALSQPHKATVYIVRDSADESDSTSSKKFTVVAKLESDGLTHHSLQKTFSFNVK